jgi:hypothetical protein
LSASRDAAYRIGMGGPSEHTLRSREQIAAFARKLVRAPIERAEGRTAARLIDLFDARRARGADPLFVPTIGAALRAGRPTLQFYCPGCQVDLRRLDWHPDTPITSLIPLASCKRCLPHPPFAKLIGLW